MANWKTLRISLWLSLGLFGLWTLTQAGATFIEGDLFRGFVYALEGNMMMYATVAMIGQEVYE